MKQMEYVRHVTVLCMALAQHHSMQESVGLSIPDYVVRFVRMIMVIHGGGREGQ